MNDDVLYVGDRDDLLHGEFFTVPSPGDYEVPRVLAEEYYRVIEKIRECPRANMHDHPKKLSIFGD